MLRSRFDKLAHSSRRVKPTGDGRDAEFQAILDAINEKMNVVHFSDSSFIRLAYVRTRFVR